MKEKIFQAQDKFINLGSQLSELFGFSEGMGRMVGFLYLSPAPVSLKAICGRLSLSKGTVSVYLRLLEDRRLIRHAWVQGGGKEKFYEINPNLWDDLRQGFIRNVKTRVELLNKTLQESRKLLKPGDKLDNSIEKHEIEIISCRLQELDEINQKTGFLLENLWKSIPEFTEISGTKGEVELKKIPIKPNKEKFD
ncbi:MAG: hypothetical protein HQM08_25225 [Candidatus Riflebacteria bacterium]|nr:hypothetical protein [Candidatus Riflebacteria bacterium]